jgi:hypothetical protein
MIQEDQESVGAWTQETFPEYNSLQHRIEAIVEEVFELGILEGLTLKDAIRIFNIVWQKNLIQRANNTSEDPSAEAADVQSCLYAYADNKGFSLQEALNKKMELCRSRPPEYYAKKVQLKKDMGFFNK